MELPDLKIIGFKIGKRRPTYNKTIKEFYSVTDRELGAILIKAIDKSDFLSVRKVKAKK